MIFKCGPIDLIYSFRIILGEKLQLEIEMNNLIQIIAIAFNGFTYLLICVFAMFLIC